MSTVNFNFPKLQAELTTGPTPFRLWRMLDGEKQYVDVYGQFVGINEDGSEAEFELIDPPDQLEWKSVEEQG